VSALAAAIRPDSWNLPLLLHVLGATVLFGATLTGASALALARGEARVLRLGYYSLLVVGLPAFILMRVAAEWIFSKEGWDDVPDDSQPAWLGIGFIISDLGAVLLLLSLILGGIGVRRLRSGGGAGLLRATMAISVLLLVAYIVAVWAMGAKPD
jgi:hypothetical protein